MINLIIIVMYPDIMLQSKYIYIQGITIYILVRRMIGQIKLVNASGQKNLQKKKNKSRGYETRY